MQFSSLPAKILRAFASSATSSYIRSVPDTTTDPNAASYQLGFPPNTFTDISAGGTPPDGRDFNGLFNAITAWLQFIGAGATVTFDSAIASAGGYPKYAVLASTTPGTLWQSTVDNNTTNPDGGAPANWVRVSAAAATAAEIIAGALDTKFATPLGLHNAGVVFVTESNQSVSGGYRVYSDGYKEVWGDFTVGGNSSVNVNYPISFETWSRAYVNGGNADHGQQDNPPFVTFSGTDHCTVYNAIDSACVCSYHAFGY